MGDEPFRQGRAPAQLDGRRGRVFSLRLSAEDEAAIAANVKRAQELSHEARPREWGWRPLSLGAFMVWAAKTWSAAPTSAGKTKELAPGKTKRRARRPPRPQVRPKRRAARR